MDIERVAEEIRAKLVPSVAASIPWSKMETGQDGYRKAAEAVLALIRADLEEAADRIEKVVCLRCKGKGEYPSPSPGTFKAFVFCQCDAGLILRASYVRGGQV